MSTHTPDWALDLLAAVIEFEDVHPKADHCLGDALKAVPGDIQAEARGWARAKRALEAGKADAPAPQQAAFEAGSTLHAERADGPAYIDPYMGDLRLPAGFARPAP